MVHLNDIDLEQIVNDAPVKLEITAGVPTWEAFPGPRHQRVIDRIRASIEQAPQADTGCTCAHLSDVYIRFRDGSLKRPDIAIFCEEPPDQDEALTIVPQAVIEVISPGYEHKDLSMNPQFYLAQDVGDVVVVDPRSGIVSHFRITGTTTQYAPITLDLQCGCRCTIPQGSPIARIPSEQDDNQ